MEIFALAVEKLFLQTKIKLSVQIAESSLTEIFVRIVVIPNPRIFPT